MLKDGIEKITDDLGQSFEEAQNTLQYQSQQQLMRYVTDPNWAVKQYAARGKFKINLLGLANKQLKAINLKYEKAFRIGLKKANATPDEYALKRLEQVKMQNMAMMTQLANQVYQAHLRFINKIQFAPDGTYEIGKLDRTNFIYNEICKVLSTKEAQQEYRAVYKDGKKFSFASYMEMNARTTLNQEIAQQQMEAAANNGDVFWLCNCFEDCRPSHIQYQGKVYYDERWESFGFDDETKKKIEQAIAERQMVSRQSVENEDPWLGSSPNCRHEFAAVPIEDVISMSDTQLLKNNNMIVAHATEEKYKLSQEQRSYERKIREYKYKVEQNKELLKNAPAGADNKSIESSIERDKQYLNKYYKKIRTLIKEHPNMERNYDRESVKIVNADLGAKFNRNKQVPMTAGQRQKAMDSLTQISIEKGNKR